MNEINILLEFAIIKSTINDEDLVDYIINKM
jgi:hypothetical protein